MVFMIYNMVMSDPEIIPASERTQQHTEIGVLLSDRSSIIFVEIKRLDFEDYIE